MNEYDVIFMLHLYIIPLGRHIIVLVVAAAPSTFSLPLCCSFIEGPVGLYRIFYSRSVFSETVGKSVTFAHSRLKTNKQPRIGS